MTNQPFFGNSDMRIPFYSTAFALFAAILTFGTAPVLAQVNVTGSWVGSSIAGGNSYPNTFSLVQNGSAVTGSGIAGNNAPGVITGTVNGSQLTFHSEYPSINYSSDAIATTDGRTMSGTFLDSQGTSGTFTAQNILPTLTPNFTIPDPPIVQIKGRNLTLTLQPFAKFQSTVAKTFERKSQGKTTIQYTITIKKGSQRLQRITKRNTETVRNLASGTYRVNYKASAIRGGKTIFSSKVSPTAVFTIKPR